MSGSHPRVSFSVAQSASKRFEAGNSSLPWQPQTPSAQSWQLPASVQNPNIAQFGLSGGRDLSEHISRAWQPIPPVDFNSNNAGSVRLRSDTTLPQNSFGNANANSFHQPANGPAIVPGYNPLSNFNPSSRPQEIATAISEAIRSSLLAFFSSQGLSSKPPK